jgi:RNA polymerase sigma-70 factor (ECF subfamily)
VTPDAPRDPQEEAALVRRCAEGDRESWILFVDRFGPLIAALARRMLRRRTGRAAEADVDEVAAEVFLALVRRDRVLLHRYDPAYRVSTYLGVICRTEVARFLRRSGRVSSGLPDAERLPDRTRPPGASVPPGPLQALADRERREAAERLRDHLSRLPERDRRLLELRYLEGLDYRAIGASLGLNPDSVGQLLTRAKARLARAVPDLEAYLTDTEP